MCSSAVRTTSANLVHGGWPLALPVCGRPHASRQGICSAPEAWYATARGPGALQGTLAVYLTNRGAIFVFTDGWELDVQNSIEKMPNEPKKKILFETHEFHINFLEIFHRSVQFNPQESNFFSSNGVLEDPCIVRCPRPSILLPLRRHRDSRHACTVVHA